MISQIGWTVKRFNRLISDKNLQKLQEERGASIVYTHFAREFVKKNADGAYSVDSIFQRQMQKLSQRKDGWFVPASILLDRLLLMKYVDLFETENAYIIINASQSVIEGLTLLVNKDLLIYNSDGQPLRKNKEGEIILEPIRSGQVVTLYKNQKHKNLMKTNPNWFATARLLMNRTIVFLKHKFGNN